MQSLSKPASPHFQGSQAGALQGRGSWTLGAVGGHGGRAISAAGSSRGLQNSASLLLSKGGGGSSSSTGRVKPRRLTETAPSSPPASKTHGSAKKFSNPASSRIISALELKTFGDRFAATHTACFLDPSLGGGFRLREYKRLRDGIYRSKLDVLNGWDPEPRSVAGVPAEQHAAAVVIQTAQRSFAARRKFEEAQWAAQKIQSHVRGVQVRKAASGKRKQRREATVRIQNNFMQHRKLETAEETAQALREAFADSVEMQRKVALALEQPVPLSELDVQHCVVGPEAAERLVKALSKASALRHLDLGYCYIGCQGARHVATHLRWSHTLKRLALPWNSIGDEGATELAQVLLKMQALKDLDLSYNRIADLGAQSLAVAVRAMPTLGSLALQANRISLHGARALNAVAREWLKLNLNANNNYEASPPVRNRPPSSKLVRRGGWDVAASSAPRSRGRLSSESVSSSRVSP